jgi:hypothetical protein
MRAQDAPPYPASEVPVGQQGDLVQDAPLVASGKPADPDHRRVEGSLLYRVQLRRLVDQVAAHVGQPCGLAGRLGSRPPQA